MKRLCVYGIVGTILAVTLITFFSGCSRQRSPSETVKSYFTALAEGNVSEVKQCLSSDFLISWEKVDGTVEKEVKQASKEAKADGGLEKIEILGEDIQGNRATIRVNLCFKNGTTGGEGECKASLVKESGVWKIASPFHYVVEQKLSQKSEKVKQESPQKAIIGKWRKRVGGDWLLSFYKDGTVTREIFGASKSWMARGEYEFMGENKIIFDWLEWGSTGWDSDIYEFKISEDKLTLIGNRGDVRRYQRVE